MSLYEQIAGLPVVVESVDFERRSVEVSAQFTRVTTLVTLGSEIGSRGPRFAGVGEDVTYDPEAHRPEQLPQLEIIGSWTIDELSKRLDSLELFPDQAPSQAAFRNYRRWAVESAALDLALIQAGRPLAAVLGREPRPLRFVSSTREVPPLGWLALYPELRFKLDATPSWTNEFVAVIAASSPVDVVDLKGAYHGTSVDNPPDAELYRRVAEGFPAAWIEDPALTPETAEALEGHRDRITWDAPIHSFADVEALSYRPRMLNSKPSRFGTLERLFEFYARCEQEGIALYGGGQFELGIGREQIQLLASVFHPNAPNDVAPSGYNAATPQAGLPSSPLEPRPAQAGFR